MIEIYHILMKNYENNFFKIQILPRSLLLALLLAPVINNLEIICIVSMSFYEYLRVFTSIYEYLRVFMSIFFYEYLQIYCILHDQSCLNYFCLSRSLLILFFLSVSINFNFFHSKMIVLPVFWCFETIETPVFRCFEVVEIPPRSRLDPHVRCTLILGLSSEFLCKWVK